MYLARLSTIYYNEHAINVALSMNCSLPDDVFVSSSAFLPILLIYFIITTEKVLNFFSIFSETNKFSLKIF